MYTYYIGILSIFLLFLFLIVINSPKQHFIENLKINRIHTKIPILTHTKIPIFIIVHNRLKVLKQSIQSYNKYIDQNKTPFEIVFYDSMSTYKPTIHFLKQQEKKGTKVYWSNLNNHKLVLNKVKDYLKQNPQCKYFVITDPDIELDKVNSNILEYYQFLLEKYKVMSVGPMLRIDDIPNYYPKKQSAIEGHTRQFWHKTPKKVKFQGNMYNIQFSPIDTTFQLFSKKNIPTNFPNTNCIRCYKPYSARHLDWYIDPNNMSRDQIYYSNKATSIAHWGKNIKD